MKPISQLKIYQSAMSPEAILKGFLKLTENPKRHLRGPMYGLNPGTGRMNRDADNTAPTDAVCGCANGIINLLATPDLPGYIDRVETRRLLNAAALKLYPKRGQSYQAVSDGLGLAAIRRVARLALKNLNA